MLYAFLLFWPATVLPILLLITLLQFFIPMNMLFRTLMGLEHHKIHIVATSVIILATLISLIGVGRQQTDPNQFAYSLVFLAGGVLLALSHNLKESIVRRQPLDMTNFNYKVSIAQLMALLFFTPLMMMVCKKFERFSSNFMIQAQAQPSLLNFVRVYLQEGVECLFSMGPGQCSYSFLSVLGYVGGVCTL